MLRRQIIRIDEEKCNGCGQCVSACAEGALQIVDGKARLVSEIYCDGLGACLGECPQGALTIEERDAEAFDEKAVKRHFSQQENKEPLPCGCPGSTLSTFAPQGNSAEGPKAVSSSSLSHWPVQLRLVPPGAPFLHEAAILVCADCVPFAVPDFHARYLAGRAVLVGCPKLDEVDYYREKLKTIFKEANPQSITVLRMEVPCCGGLAQIVTEARNETVPECPLEIHVIGIQNGRVESQVVPKRVNVGVEA